MCLTVSRDGAYAYAYTSRRYRTAQLTPVLSRPRPDQELTRRTGETIAAALLHHSLATVQICQILTRRRTFQIEIWLYGCKIAVHFFGFQSFFKTKQIETILSLELPNYWHTCIAPCILFDMIALHILRRHWASHPDRTCGWCVAFGGVCPR